MNFHTSKTKNGIRVVSISMPGVESVSAGIWAGVGSRFESESNSGVSHFLEHMLFKGTRKRSARDIVCSIEGRGAYLNAFTQEENTCYYVRTAADSMQNTFEVLSDMVASSCFPIYEVKRERGVIVEEIMMYRDLPQHVASDMLTSALWQNHPMGMSIAGTPESVCSMKKKDLVEFYRRHYVPSNIVVSFAGKVDHEKCVDMVERRLGRMKGAKTRSPKPVRANTAQQMVFLKNARIEQAHIAMGFRIFGRKDSRRYALRILNAVLGENMSSRLFYSVRERHGLAYSIHSSVHLMKDSGALVISGGFDKDSAVKAMDVTFKELHRLKTARVPGSELRRAKDYVIGQIKLGMESTSSRMIWGGEQILSVGRIIEPDDAIQKLEAVTREDVMMLAGYALDSNKLSLAGVSPDIESSEPKLHRAIARL